MFEDRRYVEERTERLRYDPGMKWSALRVFLEDQGVDPERAVLATIYDDGGSETAVIVVSDERMFLLDIDHPFERGEIARSFDDVSLIRSWHEREVRIALEMIRQEDRRSKGA